jgi:hypothetical protein
MSPHEQEPSETRVMPAHPKVFISYSRDDEAHKEWVRQLATQLRTNGVNVCLDHWHAAPVIDSRNFADATVTDLVKARKTTDVVEP